MRYVTLALLVVFIVPTWASEPGQPLDCSDWVFLEPGLRCVTAIAPLGCSPSACVDSPFFTKGHNKTIDNAGRLMVLVNERIGDCGSGTPALNRTKVVRLDGDQETVLAYVDDRCGVPNTEDKISYRWGRVPSGTDTAGEREGILTFDPTNGRIMLPLVSGCTKYANPGDCPYVAGNWLAAIEGFATTFEILQSYTPTSGPLTFRVPYMPEGFQFGDYFDTYWGDLATVGDWSQAQPLQCGYPATAPHVGDYLTVEDTLPSPAPGQGYYYVTAVNYQGQRRYGRQANGGVLSGRDPTVLPACD